MLWIVRLKSRRRPEICRERHGWRGHSVCTRGTVRRTRIGLPLVPSQLGERTTYLCCYAIRTLSLAPRSSALITTHEHGLLRDGSQPKSQRPLCYLLQI